MDTIIDIHEIPEKKLDYAGFWRRVLAALIDSLIVGAIQGVVSLIIPANSEAFSLANGMGLIVSWLYFSLMESSEKQATLGKMAMGCIVTDMHQQRISFARATGRYFSKIISAIILGIGFLMVAFTAKKQGLHDMIAETLVFKKSDY